MSELEFSEGNGNGQLAQNQSQRRPLNCSFTFQSRSIELCDSVFVLSLLDSRTVRIQTGAMLLGHVLMRGGLTDSQGPNIQKILQQDISQKFMQIHLGCCMSNARLAHGLESVVELRGRLAWRQIWLFDAFCYVNLAFACLCYDCYLCRLKVFMSGLFSSSLEFSSGLRQGWCPWLGFQRKSGEICVE